MNQAARDIIAKHEALTGPIQKEPGALDSGLVDSTEILQARIDAQQERAARRWLEAL